jgi:hypothetical protein
MIPATTKKLREAAFFLSHLEREETVAVGRSVPEAADFFFSAFLSAARSVTFVLCKEEHDRYDAWFPVWKQACSPDQRLLMDRFNKERVQAIHRTGSDLAGDVMLIPMTRIPRANTPFSAQMLWWGDSIPEIGVRRLRCTFAHDGADVEALAASQEYMAILTKLVGDFLALHDTSAA